MKIIQVCFSLKTGLTIDEIKDKLYSLKTKLVDEFGDDGYQVRSCHLSHDLCVDAGFSTEVPDTFNAVFGDQYVCELEDEKSFDSAMKNIDKYREQLSKKADKLVILAGETVTNVALELQLFTNNQVMIL